MEDIFGNQDELPQGEPEAKPEPVQQTEPEGEPKDVAPPATEGETNVPLKALEAERSKRREWKDEAMKAQGREAELRRQLDQFQRMAQGYAPPEPEPVDPVQHARLAAQNVQLDTSEMLARERFGDQAVDDAFEKFQGAIGRDPSLYQKVMSQKHPWGALVKEMQKTALLSEIGEDPAAYRERIRAEIRAELDAIPQATRAAPPQSLASARSSGARNTNFTGPTPLGDILN